jgi:hypothetical protein
MKRIAAYAVFALLGSATAAYAAAPEFVGGLVESCCKLATCCCG